MNKIAIKVSFKWPELNNEYKELYVNFVTLDNAQNSINCNKVCYLRLSMCRKLFI
jgi:hypothetical protein